MTMKRVWGRFSLPPLHFVFESGTHLATFKFLYIYIYIYIYTLKDHFKYIEIKLIKHYKKSSNIIKLSQITTIYQLKNTNNLNFKI